MKSNDDYELCYNTIALGPHVGLLSPCLCHVTLRQGIVWPKQYYSSLDLQYSVSPMYAWERVLVMDQRCGQLLSSLSFIYPVFPFGLQPFLVNSKCTFYL